MKKLFTLLSISFLIAQTLFAGINTTLQSDPPEDTYYYEFSTIEFGTSISTENKLINPNTEFELTGDSIKLFVLASMEEAFLTKFIYVDIYDENNEVVDSFEIDLEEDWNWFYFDIIFKSKGVYYIDIYNEADVFINTGSVTIK